ncbi:hypothetical protein PMAYCL1PPCAC_26919, partial [Pristionchus mayeri]
LNFPRCIINDKFGGYSDDDKIGQSILNEYFSCESIVDFSTKNKQNGVKNHPEISTEIIIKSDLTSAFIIFDKPFCNRTAIHV